MTTSTATMSTRVAFTDGESLEKDDLDNIQLYQLLASTHNFLISGIGDAIDDPAAPGTEINLERHRDWNLQGLAGGSSDQVFVPYPGCGYFEAGGSARQLVSVDGPMIFIDDDDPFGATPERVAPFRLPNGLTLTTAVGDATNPRIDLVELRATWVDGNSLTRNFEDSATRAKTSTATNKSRLVQVIVQIKQGTPAATPAYPAPTTGYAAVAAVYVPATHNAVHDPANIRDLRVPIGRIVPYDVPAHLMYRQGGTPWTLSSGNWRNDAPSSATALYAQCPINPSNGRLMGIGIYGGAVASATCKLQRIQYDLGIPSLVDIADLANGTSLFPVGGGEGFRTKTMVNLMDDIHAGGTFVGTRLANRRIGTPIWGNGFPGGPAYPRDLNGANGTLQTLAVAINGGNSSTCSFVRFYIAQGL